MNARGRDTRHGAGQARGAGADAGAFERAAQAMEAAQRAVAAAGEEGPLLEGACRALVEAGGYGGTWIGLCGGGENRALRPAAWGGIGDEAAQALGALAPASRPRVIRAVARAKDPALAALGEHGFSAACALPLRHGRELLGTLLLLDADPQAFAPPATTLLAHFAHHLGFALDTLRRRAEAAHTAQRLQLVDRALRTLSAGNRTLLHCVEEAQLLAAMCKVIVEVGGYRLAWVGYAQHDERRSILPMAAAGYTLEKVESFRLSWADTPEAQSPPARAIRSGRPCVRREFATDPVLQPFREQAEREGYKAVSAFPLIIDGEAIGNLDIGAAEAEAFGDEELAVLAELAEDLSFGIANLRVRARHRQAERTIERMAFSDALTGLPNRARLRERLAHAIERARETHRPLALLTLNVDRFREINEVLGFEQGDALVGELAGRLGQRVEPPAMLARLGVDQFGVLLPGAGAEEAQAGTQALVRALDEPFEVAGIRVDVQASVGIALFPGHGTEADRLILRSDAAMYQAKRDRSGVAVFRGDGEAENRQRLGLIAELRRAIEHDELRLFLQPKVDIASGTLCGAEALVRWAHPQRGLIAPDHFVPLAERVGLINPLTYWVANAALSLCYAWREGGFTLPLAINLSARNLQDPRLIDRLHGLLTTWGASPEWLQLELTESALMDDPKRALEILRRLDALGFRLAVDDFGTGYSSLAYLQRLPIDAVKIDKSFVIAMPNDHDAGVIVRSTVDMVHNIGLKVVAEGTESRLVWDRLAALGADVAQGTYISAPMPGEAFRAWSATAPWGAPAVH